MNRNQFKKSIFFLLIGVFTYWVVSLFFHSLQLHELVEHVPLNRELRIFLTERLVKIDTSPYTQPESSLELDGVIYVMGGSQKSLKYRFKTAAELYQKGIGEKLMVLSEPGITEYHHHLGRNLSNDEWAIKELINLEVRKGDIEFVALGKGFFGTIREAKAVSALVLKRGHKRLILVSSSYHTKRVWVTFSRIMMNNNVILDIYSSDEDINLWGLLLEYFKLISYKYIILPIYVKLPG